MKPEKSMKLKRLIEWMQDLTTTSAFSGVTRSADTVHLTFYSFEECTLCIADVELENGTFEWTYR